MTHRCFDGVPEENTFDVCLAETGAMGEFLLCQMMVHLIFALLHTDGSFFCDGCDAVITDSYRYKCLQCPDLNLCMACEQQSHRRHLMLRFSGERMESFNKNYETLFESSFGYYAQFESLYFQLLVSITFKTRTQVVSGVEIEKQGNFASFNIASESQDFTLSLVLRYYS
jgi:Zinc finger, ZZ type